MVLACVFRNDPFLLGLGLPCLQNMFKIMIVFTAVVGLGLGCGFVYFIFV